MWRVNFVFIYWQTNYSQRAFNYFNCFLIICWYCNAQKSILKFIWNIVDSFCFLHYENNAQRFTNTQRCFCSNFEFLWVLTSYLIVFEIWKQLDNNELNPDKGPIFWKMMIVGFFDDFMNIRANSMIKKDFFLQPIWPQFVGSSVRMKLLLACLINCAFFYCNCKWPNIYFSLSCRNITYIRLVKMNDG